MLPSDLLADPAAWTQGSFGRDANGLSVEEDNPAAVKFCLIGACYKVAPCGAVAREWCYALERMIHRSLTSWNDAHDRTHGEVIALLKSAGL